MEIIHHGKVTKHAQDLDEYRPKFSVKMHHDDKNCGSAIPQMLYIGDEDCHKLGITSYIGRRIDENVLDLLSIIGLLIIAFSGTLTILNTPSSSN